MLEGFLPGGDCPARFVSLALQSALAAHSMYTYQVDSCLCTSFAAEAATSLSVCVDYLQWKIDIVQVKLINQQ